MVRRVAAISIVFGLSALVSSDTGLAQTREKGPWWPSAFGPTDQAGATNYITPAKVIKAVQLVKTGQMYELGHIYEASMPQFGSRPYFREDSLEPGDGILFNYGWAVNWTNPSKYNDSRFGVGENKGSPGIGVEVARWVVERKASMVGADSCCVMVNPAPTPATGNVHHELLFHGSFLLENMDLRDLARDRVYEFLFVCATERIKGATGSLVRPLAIR